MKIPKTTELTLSRIVENLAEIPTKFGENKNKLSKEQKNKLVEMACMFESLGESFRGEKNIIEAAKSVVELCELAEAYALHENDDWFNEKIIAKDMKILRREMVEFQKIIRGLETEFQKLQITYENMGHILGRYFEINSSKSKGSGESQSNIIQQENLT